MSRIGRDSDKHVFSSMDGVSVKISEHFKPPPKVGLPAGYQQRLSAETNTEDYDFKLEHSVLEKMTEWRQLRKSVVESRRERVRSANEAKLSDLPPTLPNEPLAGSSMNQSCPVSPNPSSITPLSNHFNTHNDSILTPMQIVQPSLIARTSQISQFNFSDFEADTSSPFDNMELKTINEMEVLAHVLQPPTNSPDSNKNCFSPAMTDDTLRPAWSKYRNDNVTWSGNQTTHNSYEFWPMGDIEASESSKVPIPIERLNISQDNYTMNRFNQSQSIPIKKVNPSDDRGGQRTEAASKTQSRSVPDIVHQLEKELQSKVDDRNIESQTLRPSSFDSTGLENWKPWPSLDSPQHSCLKKVAVASSVQPLSALANPFNELSQSAQRLVKHISEMGFDLARVARACQSVGQDDKKIVEYLLEIQFLEAANFESDAAERALVANGFERSRTVSHLEAMKQLLDLGFQEQNIFDALVRFNNDRDKALDHLIA